jgi:glycine cleavage system H protein
MSEYLQTVFDKFELRVRKGCSYSRDGIWVRVEDDAVRIGLSDYLQRTSGDVAFVETVKEGLSVEREAEIGNMETAKAVLSLSSPISGTVVSVNSLLSDKPELVNSDPYGEGWLAILKPRDLENDLKTLMSAEDYFDFMLGMLRGGQGKLGSG